MMGMPWTHRVINVEILWKVKNSKEALTTVKIKKQTPLS